MQAVDSQLLLLLPFLKERFQKLNSVPVRDLESWVCIFSQYDISGFSLLRFLYIKDMWIWHNSVPNTFIFIYVFIYSCKFENY